MASRYETVEVPFFTIGNRQCLSREQLENLPWLAVFFARFRHCFVQDEMCDVFWYEPPTNA